MSALPALPALSALLLAGLLILLALLALALLPGLLTGLLLSLSALAALTLLALLTLLTLLLTLLALIHIITHWRPCSLPLRPRIQNSATHASFQKNRNSENKNPGVQGRELHAGIKFRKSNGCFNNRRAQEMFP